MKASQHSLLAACFTLHSINATLAIVPQRGAGLWMSGGINLPFLTSALDGGELSASRHGRFTPGEIVQGTHWIGGSVGP
jgi:hypothetical protein